MMLNPRTIVNGMAVCVLISMSAGSAGAAVLTLGDLGVGDLVISEFMADPDAVSDANGEYFEVFNPNAMPVNLNGLTFSDNSATTNTINVDYIADAGSYTLFARNLDQPTNGGLESADFQFTFSLNNTGDSISLSSGDTTFTTLTYGISQAGNSLELKGTVDFSDGTTDEADYAFAAVQYGDGDGDFGTPTSTPEVPEPATLALLATGLGLLFRRR